MQLQQQHPAGSENIQATRERASVCEERRRQCSALYTDGKSRLYFLAGVCLALAAVVAVAVAVPVSQRARQTPTPGDTQSNGPPRQLEALQSSRNAGQVQREAAARQQQLEPVCQGIPGLCRVPVRLVTFPGTHNSNAMKTTFPTLAQHQKLTFAEQLKAGGRLFDLDYAGGRFGARFGHCMSCLCAFSEDENENDPVKVFKTMADFLAANPREVIVLGLSNINCGDKDAARQQLLGILAASPLSAYLMLQAIGPTTKLGELVDSNQRAVLLFYDQWTTPAGHQIGTKFVPNQALWRIYGGDVSVDGRDPVTIDTQVSQGLLAGVVKQISTPQPALTPGTPWRIMGLFPSSCLVCRAAGVCGPISCAEKANSESFILFILGKATSRWTRNRNDQKQLVPAFNGFQIDYLQPEAKANVVTAAKKVNTAMAAMYTSRPVQAPQLGLGNCVWVLDDTAAAGGLVCSGDGSVSIQTLLGLPAAGSAAAAAVSATAGRRMQQQGNAAGGGSKRHILVPANPALVLRTLADGKVRKEVKGLAGQAQLLDLSLTATHLQASLVD